MEGRIKGGKRRGGRGEKEVGKDSGKGGVGINQEEEKKAGNGERREIREEIHNFYMGKKINHSLVPRPHPVFRCFQYEKAGEGLVSFLT